MVFFQRFLLADAALLQQAGFLLLRKGGPQVVGDYVHRLSEFFLKAACVHQGRVKAAVGDGLVPGFSDDAGSVPQGSVYVQNYSVGLYHRSAIL